VASPSKIYSKKMILQKEFILFIGLIACFLFPDKTNAQQIDSSFSGVASSPKIDTILYDSIKVRKSNFFTKNYPSPRKAALLSILVPGAGQAYNKKFWKMPLAWGVGITPIVFIVINKKNRNEFRRNYKARVDGNLLTLVDEKYKEATTEGLKQARDVYQKRLEISYLATAGGYLLIATDAFVDAHLKTFDVSDDLSLKIAPRVLSSPHFSSTFGVGLCFNLK
jgi:Family of unknown function (DUF5683)